LATSHSELILKTKSYTVGRTPPILVSKGIRAHDPSNSGDEDITFAHFFSNNNKQIASVVQWSEFLATDPEVRVPFPALQDFLRSSESGTGSTQPREYN
jgi:hypothetical protein